MSKLSQAGLIDSVAESLDMSPRQIKKVLKTTEKKVYEELAKENSVQILKGLIVSGQRKEAYKNVQPLDATTMTIPSRIVPRAKFTYTARNTINE